jgi:hypothetical protein|tara:strand:+ start:192 stop:830 length:639 start_codon:yes stop_codon:yes gene_type:complete
MPFPSTPMKLPTLPSLSKSSFKTKEDISTERKLNADIWQNAIQEATLQASVCCFQAFAGTTEYGSSLESIIENQWYEAVNEFLDSEPTNRKTDSPQLFRRYDFSNDKDIKLLENSDIPNPTKFNKNTQTIEDVNITFAMILSWKDQNNGPFPKPGQRLRHIMTSYLPLGKTVLIFPVRNKDATFKPWTFDIKIVDDGNLGDTDNKYDWKKYF